MKLTFWGAARQVTGSMFLLELDDDYRILIDCGTEMAREHDDAHEEFLGAEPSNGTPFPFDASSINLVLLTHAHIDHSGNLPNLVRYGYEGQILCTSATYTLSQLLLQDSASLHKRKLMAMQHSKRGTRRRKEMPNTAEMFLEQHVEDTAERFVTIAFKNRFKIKNGVWITFIPTGHLLGAANILLEVEEDGQRKKIGFSGDVGRRNYPLLPDPEPFPEVDYLICESTYGNRRHKAQGTPEDILADVIKRTCIDIPGRLIIPAFSVGRTQALLYTLNRLYTERGFTPIRVFSDSPMALKSTEIHQKYVKLLNKEAQEFNEEHDELFDFDNLHYVENMEQSRQISSYHEPSIIISSSGMISGGRVEDHIRKNIQNPYCTIFMVGFAAEGTLGYRLMHGQKTLRVGDKEVPIMANVEHTDVFSGHADLDDLLHFVQQQNPAKLQKLFVVHGEYNIMLDFKASLNEIGFDKVEIPKKGQTFLL